MRPGVRNATRGLARPGPLSTVTIASSSSDCRAGFVKQAATPGVTWQTASDYPADVSMITLTPLSIVWPWMRRATSKPSTSGI